MSNKKNQSKTKVVAKDTKKNVSTSVKEEKVITKVVDTNKGKTFSVSKNTLIVLVVLLVLVLLSIFVSVNEETESTDTTNSSSNVSSDITSWVNETSEDKYVITVIGLSYCSHCANYSPVIEAIAEENNITLYWFDIDELSDDDSNTLVNTYNLEQYEGASPYTVVTKNGEFVADVVGELTEDETEEFLRTYGVIE